MSLKHVNNMAATIVDKERANFNPGLMNKSNDDILTVSIEFSVKRGNEVNFF